MEIFQNLREDFIFCLDDDEFDDILDGNSFIGGNIFDVEFVVNDVFGMNSVNNIENIIFVKNFDLGLQVLLIDSLIQVFIFRKKILFVIVGKIVELVDSMFVGGLLIEMVKE